jgi:pullulanase/glycogen debranching enzyme
LNLYQHELYFIPELAKKYIFISANNNIWEDMLVLLNGNRAAVDFQLLEGNWKILCHDGEINLNGIANVQGVLRVEASSASVLVRVLNG